MLTIFFGVMFGVFSLGFTIPNFKAIVDGTAAGFQAFKVIKRNPPILRNDPSRRSEDTANIINGDIEFKNVSFRYKSSNLNNNENSEDSNVLNSINLKFKHGKSTAIVGPSGSGKSTIA